MTVQDYGFTHKASYEGGGAQRDMEGEPGWACVLRYAFFFVNKTTAGLIFAIAHFLKGCII